MRRFIALLVWLVPVAIVSAQDVCTRARTIFDRVKSIHIQPRQLDDSFSEDVFDEFFHTLDRDSKFFIAGDTATFSRFRRQLDDKNPATCEFVDKVRVLFKQRAGEYALVVDSVLSRPIDLTRPGYRPATRIETSWCLSRAELNERIVTDLKLSVLTSMYRQAAFDSTNLSDNERFMKFEPAARQRVRKNVLAELNKVLKDDASLKMFVEKSYLKSIPKVFDPHSSFYSQDEARYFSERLDPEALSFGIKLEETTRGDVKVAKVVPGGPAWNSNQVNNGDALTGLKWEKSGEYVDLMDLELHQVEGMLDRPDEIQAVITLRKPTGETRDVRLTKHKLENEDNIVSGYVLRGKDRKRTIGYISLPGFFTDEDANSRGCAVAVTKELIKLKSESIEGLILDLRFNGGGSLREAIEMIGLFIDVGPVGIIEVAGKAPVTLKDANMGVAYAGPLVVMVNGASASASEMVAGTLQDYNRAIIAGSRTYGKATGQEVNPIDKSALMHGYLKVTSMQLYHIDGTSHQATGVEPDFLLPDIYSKALIREDQQPYALKPGAMNKKTYYTKWPGDPSEVVKAAAAEHSTKFGDVSKLEELLMGPVPVESKEYVAYMRKLERAYRMFTSGNSDKEAIYDVTNSAFDASTLQTDPYHAEMNQAVIRQIRSSIYIPEVYKLLDNLISRKQ